MKGRRVIKEVFLQEMPPKPSFEERTGVSRGSVYREQHAPGSKGCICRDRERRGFWEFLVIQSGWSVELQGWGMVISERSRQKPHFENPCVPCGGVWMLNLKQ